MMSLTPPPGSTSPTFLSPYFPSGFTSIASTSQDEINVIDIAQLRLRQQRAESRIQLASTLGSGQTPQGNRKVSRCFSPSVDMQLSNETVLNHSLDAEVNFLRQKLERPFKFLTQVLHGDTHFNFLRGNEMLDGSPIDLTNLNDFLNSYFIPLFYHEFVPKQEEEYSTWILTRLHSSTWVNQSADTVKEMLTEIGNQTLAVSQNWRLSPLDAQKSYASENAELSTKITDIFAKFYRQALLQTLIESTNITNLSQEAKASLLDSSLKAFVKFEKLSDSDKELWITHAKSFDQAQVVPSTNLLATPPRRPRYYADSPYEPVKVCQKKIIDRLIFTAFVPEIVCLIDVDRLLFPLLPIRELYLQSLHDSSLNLRKEILKNLELCEFPPDIKQFLLRLKNDILVQEAFEGTKKAKSSNPRTILAVALVIITLGLATLKLGNFVKF